MARQIMPFEKFEYIMKQLQAYEEKRNRISDFFEEELCTDSWCLFNVGEELTDSLTCLLADEFNCWYHVELTPIATEALKELQELTKQTESKKDSDRPTWWDKSIRRWDNDIEYWLFEEHKVITIEGEDIPIGTLREFYDYLVKYCVDKKEN